MLSCVLALVVFQVHPWGRVSFLFCRSSAALPPGGLIISSLSSIRLLTTKHCVYACAPVRAQGVKRPSMLIDQWICTDFLAYINYKLRGSKCQQWKEISTKFRRCDLKRLIMNFKNGTGRSRSNPYCGRECYFNFFFLWEMPELTFQSVGPLLFMFGDGICNGRVNISICSISTSILSWVWSRLKYDSVFLRSSYFSLWGFWLYIIVDFRFSLHSGI